MRVVLRLGRPSETGSIFCPRGDDRAELGATLADVAAARQRADQLTFVGGDAFPLLLDGVAAAREAGFVRVGLCTSPRWLAAQDALASLHAAGLTDLLVLLHGPSAGCHDYHVGRAGDFAATMAGLAAARAAGLDVAVKSVVTRSNFRALAALGLLIVERGAVGWLLELPAWIEATEERFIRVVPRLGLALPYALHALDRTLALGLESFVRGAPLCRLGRLARRALGAAPRSFAPVCERCAARARCSGVDPAYLGRYGADELAALEREAPPLDAAPDEIVRMLLADER